MKRKHTEKSPVYLASREDLSDISDIEDAYDEKVKAIQKQLDQLDQKLHPDYVKVKEGVEGWYEEQKQRIQILYEHKLENIHREYNKEIEACDRDCENEKKRIQDYLVSLCEELKRRLEHDKKNIELTPSGDILEFKPAVTRKLRRRAGTDMATSNPSNFAYWGDILLCGTRWPLNTNPNSRNIQSDATNPSEVRSPIPNSGDPSNSDPTTTETSTDFADTHKSFNRSSTTTTTTASQCDVPATSCAPSTSATNKSNLFGSLGLNLFDGSLLSHLLASMNNIGPLLPNALLANSAPIPSSGNLNSFLNGPPTGSAAAAVAAGFIMPSAGLSNGVVLAPALAGLTQQPLARRRRQQNTTPNAQLNLLLPENDIYADLTIIHRACAKASNLNSSGGNATITTGSGRKQSHGMNHLSSNTTNLPASFSSTLPIPDDSNATPNKYAGTRDTAGRGPSPSHAVGSGNQNTSSGGGARSDSLASPTPNGNADNTGRSSRTSSNNSSTTLASVWIDDGRLYCGKKWYQNGTSVTLEGRDGSNQRCTGTIVSIGVQDLAIQRSSDHGIVRVTVQQLKQGRYILGPSKSD